MVSIRVSYFIVSILLFTSCVEQTLDKQELLVEQEKGKIVKEETIKNKVEPIHSDSEKSVEKEFDEKRKEERKIVKVGEINYSQHLSHPQVSPNGKYVAATTEGNLGILIFDINSKQNVAEIGLDKKIGFDVFWNKQSNKIYFKERIDRQWITKSYSIESQKVVELKEVNPKALQSWVLAEGPEDPIVFITKDLKIGAQTLDNSKEWVITKEDGQFYNPVLSPHKEHVIVHKGSKMIYHHVRSLDNYFEIADGIATCWHPTKLGFFYFLDTSTDGHQITGSDIYFGTLSSKEYINLTKTDDLIEMWPSVSSDGKTLICEEFSSGKLFIYALDI